MKLPCDPGVLQSIACGIPSSWRHRCKPHKKTPRNLGKGRVRFQSFDFLQFGFECIISVFFFGVDRVFTSRVNEMHYNTDCPNVYSFCILFTSCDFRCHECESSTILILSFCWVCILITYTKIYKLDGAKIILVLNQNILRFQISMNNALLMNIIYTFQNAL
jgi:hypothetical protein